jgi:hypothetical protein|tara:strand:+ start:562 stop:804 length:243 start_codon:yes stop_codon:yes gene_type:complete
MQKKRDYKKEYREYHGKASQIKDRASRNSARNTAVKKGSAYKGDGKEVDHKDNNPRNNSSGNTRVMSKAANRARPRRKIG